MTIQVSVAGGTPTWRRGIRAVLEDAGMAVATFDSFTDWQPGVVDDEEESEELVAVVEAALSERSAIPRPILKAMAQTAPDDQDLSAWISHEDTSWLREMASGLTVIELADDCGYSERAMFRMLRDLNNRIGVRDRTGALLRAGRHGLLVD